MVSCCSLNRLAPLGSDQGLGIPPSSTKRLTCSSFVACADQDSVQMLTRSTQIGEFYTMQPPQVRPARGAEGFTCDIMIYDEEADRHVRIRWVDAMAACCIVDTKDRPGGADLVGANAADFIGAAINLSPQGVGGTTGQWRDAAMSIAAFNAGTDNGGDAYADDAAYSTRYNNLNKNIRIVIARPFIEHLMHSVIVCVSGRDTGATLFGPADMQLSANTQVKTIEGAHFTIRTPPTNHTRTPISLSGNRISGCTQVTTRATSRP